MGINTTASTGARGAIRMGEETTYGVVVSPTHIIDFNTESLAATENIIESEAIREDRGRHKLIQGTLDVGGDITYEQSFGGYGMMIRNALGDYVRCAGADGGIRARVAVAASELSDGHDGTDKYIIECTAEASSDFTDAASLVAVVYRDASDNLVFDDNTASGHAYTDFALGDETYVVSVDNASTAYTGYSSTAVTELTLADVLDADGNLVAPTFNPDGGIIRCGADRDRYRYFEYVAGAGGGADDSVLYLEPADVVTHGDPSANDAAIGAPSFVKATSDFTLPAAGVKLGAWLYEYNTTWPAAGVYTHHIERGKVLPTGLTIEVNRDAAIFLYSGMKVNTITWNYDANSIVTSTVSFVGKQEYAMAELVGDVVPGATSIVISEGETFPTTTQGGGTITIGEETGITYTTKVDNANGTSTLSGIPSSGSASIERIHLDGTNVDSRTTTEADIYTVDYDAQTTNLTDGETITFSGGGSATLIDISDSGATGTITFQMISGTVPVNDETITGSDSGGDGTVDGTPAAVAVYSGNTSPLTAFESNVYIDGGFEEVLSASVTLNNNLNGDKFGLGSRFRFQLVEEQAVVEASITVEFDDGKNYVKFKSGTFFSLELKAISESADSEIGTTGVLSGQYLFMPKCKFTGTTPNIAGTSFIQHDMPITCIVDDDFATKDLICVLVNNLPNDVERP
jgi:hypothetical protein